MAGGWGPSYPPPGPGLGPPCWHECAPPARGFLSRLARLQKQCPSPGIVSEKTMLLGMTQEKLMLEPSFPLAEERGAEMGYVLGMVDVCYGTDA